MKSMGLMLFSLLKDIDEINIVFILMGIPFMTLTVMVLKPKLHIFFCFLRNYIGWKFLHKI
jgi:hypothetical protein